MSTGQVLCASVFLAGYSLALGRFAGRRSRLIAIVTALLAAIGFVALGNPWEVSVILLALAPLGMGLFAIAVWAVYKVTAARPRPAPVVSAPPSVGAGTRIGSPSLLRRLRSRRRFT